MPESPQVLAFGNRLYQLAASDLTPAAIAARVGELGSVGAAATALKVSPEVVEAALRTTAFPVQAQSADPPATGPVDAIKNGLALITSLVALVVVLGGAVLAIRLAFANLPPEAAFAQLPRDFLIATGTSQVFAPALVVVALHALTRSLWPNEGATTKFELSFVAAVLFLFCLALLALAAGVAGPLPKRSLNPTYWIVATLVLALAVTCTALIRWQWSSAGERWHWRHGPPWLTLSLAYGLVAMIVATLASATVPLLPAKACMASGFSRPGDLVGQGSDRIYLGESVRPPRRIASLPAADVQQLFIGTNARDATCEPVGHYGPVLAHASAERARTKLASTADALRELSSLKAGARARSVTENFISTAHRALRATLTTAEAGGIMNDTIRENHPDEAALIGDRVRASRDAVFKAGQALDRVERALHPGGGRQSSHSDVLGTATAAIDRVTAAVDSARRTEEVTYEHSPLLVAFTD